MISSSSPSVLIIVLVMNIFGFPRRCGQLIPLNSASIMVFTSIGTPSEL